MLCNNTTTYEETTFRTIADMLKVDAGTAAAPLRRRDRVVDGSDDPKLLLEAYSGKEIELS